MTFNLVSAPNPHTFADVKIGEGFFFAPKGYFIKIANNYAIRVWLAKNQLPAEEIFYENSLDPNNSVDEIYHNLSITMG